MLASGSVSPTHHAGATTRSGQNTPVRTWAPALTLTVSHKCDRLRAKAVSGVKDLLRDPSRRKGCLAPLSRRLQRNFIAPLKGKGEKTGPALHLRLGPARGMT